MHRSHISHFALAALFLLLVALGSFAQSVGTFEGHQDVGTVLHPGSTDYDAAKNQSRIHFQALAPSRHTRDILLGYVFNILSDGRDAGPKKA